MTRDLPAELRSAAERLQRLRNGDHDERIAATREFWRLARMLRAAQPPLLLPHRSGPSMLRFGYLFDASSSDAALAAAIERAHSDAGERVLLFLIGRGAAPPSGSRIVNLSGMPEAQAIRVIAHADLDVLVDVAGSALVAMPMLIAFHPARAVVEPMCLPVASAHADDAANEDETGHEPSPPGLEEDAASLVATARRAARVAFPPLGIDLNSTELAHQLDQAVRHHRAGTLEGARAGYSAVLDKYPDHPTALYLLGQLLSQQGKTTEAIALLRRASSVAPEFRDAHYSLAQRLADQGEWAEAARAYSQVVDLTPQFAPAWSGLGLASLRDRNGGDAAAIRHLERAVALEPDSSQWHFNLGTAYQRAARLADARHCYERSLARNPGDAAARFNLGAVLQEQREYPGAIAAYQRVLAENPGFDAAYPELGACLQLTGQIEAWLENFRDYRAHRAESLPMAVYGLEASMAAGDPAAHARWVEGICAGNFAATDNEEFLSCWEQLLFLLLHVDVDRGTLRELYEQYDAVASNVYGPRMPEPVPRGGGRIRVGYLSGDYRDHVMGRMIFEWVSRHDRSRFAVTLYSMSSARDSWTDRFKALGVGWCDLSPLSLDDASARIHADCIDILVDCAGHTRNGRPGILARKPARLQATHIATPGPLGLHAVDYKLTDSHAEASDAQRYMIERLLPVPGGVFPWHRHNIPRGLAAARQSGAFVCGAFVSLLKLSPRCLALWRRLLDEIPNAVIALSPPHPEWRNAYTRWLGAHGIANKRITFVPYADDEPARLARYRSLDVCLDPMPCGNVNGTMEALAMGVPVITLVGTRHGERLGNALLTRFGITDTIASTDDEYIAIAAMIARDPAFTVKLRERIAGLAVDSPVWDSDAQVRHVEGIYERVLAERALATAQ